MDPTPPGSCARGRTRARANHHCSGSPRRSGPAPRRPPPRQPPRTQRTAARVLAARFRARPRVAPARCGHAPAIRKTTASRFRRTVPRTGSSRRATASAIVAVVSGVHLVRLPSIASGISFCTTMLSLYPGPAGSGWRCCVPLSGSVLRPFEVFHCRDGRGSSLRGGLFRGPFGSLVATHSKLWRCDSRRWRSSGSRRTLW